MKKNRLLIGGALLTIGIAAVLVFNAVNKPLLQETTPITTAPENFKNGKDIFISPDELKEQLGSKNLIILDGSHPKSK